jgi:hypothetical protein
MLDSWAVFSPYLSVEWGYAAIAFGSSSLGSHEMIQVNEMLLIALFLAGSSTFLLAVENPEKSVASLKIPGA